MLAQRIHPTHTSVHGSHRCIGRFERGWQDFRYVLTNVKIWSSGSYTSSGEKKHTHMHTIYDFKYPLVYV